MEQTTKTESLKVVLLVECPYCKARRKFEMKNRNPKVKCFVCGRSYALFPRKRPSRVVSIIEGSLKDLFRIRYANEKPFIWG